MQRDLEKMKEKFKERDPHWVLGGASNMRNDTFCYKLERRMRNTFILK